MPRSSSLDGWRLLNGKWTLSLGSRGNRVRLFQKRRDGAFYREVWVPGRGRDRKCLETSDRREADRFARRLQAELVLGVAGHQPGGRITLKELWDRFSTECPAYLDNQPRTKKEAGRRVRILFAHFGEQCDVRQMGANDQAAFVTARLNGGIRISAKEISKPVRARTPEADLVLLHTMLNWATTVRIQGNRWLESSPLQGIRRPRELNPKRPVATWERFTKSRAAIRGRIEFSGTDEERARWLKMDLALVLAQATGRRLSSIRHLRWEDLDFVAGTIHWRAEHDKRRKAWVIPYPPEVWEEIRQFRRKLRAVGGWLFPGEKRPDQPMDRHLFDKWLTVAEETAGLAKLDGGLWHPYRRAWATARKDLPLKDVAAAGGWSDVDTLLTCYQQPDRQTLLRVTSQERRIHEVVVGGNY